ncbi:hypothetical protein [Deinococcus planocerae]|uniref:hypothetical protein n=1 Tax=Deinococcus planocerae TaxID=1737569 RepID=UPI000C7ECC52|nr:hypothetical protein [Deinococcus planocerae]
MTHARPVPPITLALGPIRPEGEVFGTLIAEVLTPDGHPTVPRLPDWELRAWAVARLGDATLEARPRRPGLAAGDLDGDLRGAGYTPLGPIRRARR